MTQVKPSSFDIGRKGIPPSPYLQILLLHSGIIVVLSNK